MLNIHKRQKLIPKYCLQVVHSEDATRVLQKESSTNSYQQLQWYLNLPILFHLQEKLS